MLETFSPPFSFRCCLFIYFFPPLPLTLIINYLVTLFFPTIQSKCSHLLWIKESLLNSMIHH